MWPYACAIYSRLGTTNGWTYGEIGAGDLRMYSTTWEVSQLLLSLIPKQI